MNFKQSHSNQNQDDLNQMLDLPTRPKPELAAARSRSKQESLIEIEPAGDPSSGASNPFHERMLAK